MRFEDELWDENVLDDDLDEDETAPSEVLVDEIYYARYGPVHEQRRAPYGSMVLPGTYGAVDYEALFELLEEGFSCDIRWLNDDESAEELSPEELGELRKLADGEESFLLTSSEGVFGLVLMPESHDSSLAYLAKSRPPIVSVRRARDGSIVAFGTQAAHYLEQDTWRASPYLGTDEMMVLGMALGAESWSALNNVLHFCQFELSPAHIGATFVLQLDDGRPIDRALFAKVGRPPPIEVSFADRSIWTPLAGLLDQVDGAVIVDVQGSLQEFEVHLGATDEAVQAIPAIPGRGTRHLSARRFSFDEPGCVAVVVSQDGPISVYSDGADPLTYNPLGQSWALWLSGFGRIHDARFVREVRECATCRKRIAVGAVLTGTDRDTHAVVCPVCEHVLEADRAAFAVSATPLKPWHDDRMLDHWEMLASRPPWPEEDDDWRE